MKNKYSIFSLIKNAFTYHENWQRAWRDPEPKKNYDAVIVDVFHGRLPLTRQAVETLKYKKIGSRRLVLAVRLRFRFLQPFVFVVASAVSLGCFLPVCRQYRRVRRVS